MLSITVLDEVADNWTAWLDGAQLTGANRAAFADVDGDGVSNAIEFATGRNPGVNDADGGPVSIETIDGYFCIQFVRNPAARFLNPRIQFSETLDSWETAVDGKDEISIDTIAEESTGNDRLTVWIPATPSGKIFVRLVVDSAE